MTKQELLQAIRANLFASDEELVDYIFDVLPEIKQADVPMVKCRYCKYAQFELSEFGHIDWYCCRLALKPVLPDHHCEKGKYAVTNPEIEETKKAADKFFIGGDEE